jgi:hypothetical protein
MILAMALFRMSALFSIQLIALTAAIFLFLYIKKQDLNKWYSFASAAIIGLVLMSMAACFIGAVCMHCCGGHRGEGNEEKRIIIRGGEDGMGMGMRGEHRRMMMHMGEGHGGAEMNCCPEMKGHGEMRGCEGMEGCEGMKGCEMECCKGKEGHCDMDGKKVIITKDTVAVKKVAPKK